MNFNENKSWIGLICLIAVALFLVACSSDEGLVITDKRMEMNDSEFSGVVEHSAALAEGDVVTVDTRGNAFDIAIIHESGVPIPLSGNGVSGGNLQHVIVEAGEYMITVEGSGRFSISWE